MKNRISSPNITSLKPNEIFVFGSNLSGFHAGGAAKAALSMGAIWGEGVGLHGQTYAIPTIKKNMEGVMIIRHIKYDVDEFIQFAKSNPQLIFLVTEIGCGIAGFTVEQIAPLFTYAKEVENIHLPERFWEVLNR